MLLFFRRDRVAGDGRSKAALRANAEPGKWKILCSSRDALAQVIEGFELAGLGAYQAEHDEFVFGDVLERLERTRAIIVVLEQEPVYFEALEELPADRLVTSLGEPPAALIAASEMKGESDTG